MRWWSRVKRQGGRKALCHQQPSCHEATACPQCYILVLHHVSQRAHLLCTALARPAHFRRSVSQPQRASEAMYPSVPRGRGIKSVPGGSEADDAGSAARGSNRTTSVALEDHLVRFARGRSTSHHNRKPPLQLLLWFQKASQNGSSLITGDIEMLPRPASVTNLLPIFQDSSTT